MSVNILRLHRTRFSDKSTIGELYAPDGLFYCHTLEDAVRIFKVPGKTAIPAGNYEIVIAWSERFKRLMPRILSVPFFDGVLIHKGNIDADTEGCVLVGKKCGQDCIWESAKAFDELFPKIRRFCGEGKLFIEIEGGHRATEWVNPPDLELDKKQEL